MKWLWIIVTMMVVPTQMLYAQDVYTWEDENGVVHFGEAPSGGGAKRITLTDHTADAPKPEYHSSQPVDQPRAKTAKKAEPKPEKKEKKKTKLAIRLLSPQHDASIRSNSGLITVQGELNRKLGIDENLQLMMDGSPYGAPTNKPLWSLKNIDRGTHTFSIQAFKGGKLIASSSIATVHLHRARNK